MCCGCSDGAAPALHLHRFACFDGVDVSVGEELPPPPGTLLFTASAAVRGLHLMCWCIDRISAASGEPEGCP